MATGIQLPKSSATTGQVSARKPLEHSRRPVTPAVSRPSSAAHSRRAHQPDRVELKPTAPTQPAAAATPASHPVSAETAKQTGQTQDTMFGVVGETEPKANPEAAEQNAGGFFSEASKFFNPETRHQVNYGVMLTSLVTFAVDVFYHPLFQDAPPTSKLGQMGLIAKTLAEHHHLDHAKVTELVGKGAQIFEKQHRYAQSMKAPNAKKDEAQEQEIHGQAGSLLSELGEVAKKLFVAHQQVRAANPAPADAPASQTTQATPQPSTRTQTEPSPAPKPTATAFSFTHEDRNGHALHQLSSQTLQRAIRLKTGHGSQGLAFTFTDPASGARETVRAEKDLDLGRLLKLRESHPDLQIDVALDVGTRAPREGNKVVYGKGRDPLREHYEPVVGNVTLGKLLDPAYAGRLQQAALDIVEHKSPKTPRYS